MKPERRSTWEVMCLFNNSNILHISGLSGVMHSIECHVVIYYCSVVNDNRAALMEYH